MGEESRDGNSTGREPSLGDEGSGLDPVMMARRKVRTRRNRLKNDSPCLFAVRSHDLFG